MKRFFYLATSALAVVATTLADENLGALRERQPTPVFQYLKPRQTQQAGTPLYLDEPSCNSYQCNTTYHPGDTATAHWLDAPEGNVILDMIPHPDNATGHHVAIVPGTTTNCDAEGQKTCGQFSWIVPSDWAPGNYTLQATSQSQPNLQSYTDIILVTIQPGNASQTNVAFKALDPVVSNSTSSSGDSGSVTSTSAAGSAATSASGSSGTSPQTTSSSSSSSSKKTGSSNAATSAFANAEIVSLVASLGVASLLVGTAL